MLKSNGFGTRKVSALYQVVEGKLLIPTKIQQGSEHSIIFQYLTPTQARATKFICFCWLIR
jgi:hypothetical protein